MSAYQPTVGAKRSVSVSPHRPSALLPSSSLSYTAGGGLSSSSATSTAGSRKVFDGSSRAGAAGGGAGVGGGTSALTPDTEVFPPKESDEVDIGFVPSFLEPGRQPRQKRYSTAQHNQHFMFDRIRQKLIIFYASPLKNRNYLNSPQSRFSYSVEILAAAQWVTPCRGVWGQGGPRLDPWTTWTSLWG